MAGEITGPTMDANEAWTLTARIKNAADDVAFLIYEAHAGRAWQALGYRSWEQYLTDELEVPTTTATTAIARAGVMPVSGRQALVLVRDPRAAKAVAKRIADGQPPAEAVAAVVASTKPAARARAKSERGASKPTTSASTPEPTLTPREGVVREVNDLITRGSTVLHDVVPRERLVLLHRTVGDALGEGTPRRTAPLGVDPASCQHPTYLREQGTCKACGSKIAKAAR